MFIGSRTIGAGSPPLVIAEIGINHGGSLDVAKAMVRAAAQSGCECIKHQTHFVEDEMTNDAKDIFPPNADESIWDVISNNSLKAEDEIELKRYAESLGLIYLSTPFSRKAADFLDEIGVPAFKIGSGECANIPLVEHIAAKGKPVVMSTGMHSISELKQSVEILRSANVDFALLECTNLYPSPPEIVSLAGINELRDAFPGVEIGFSDHSIGPYMALAAVGLGASVIERHFTDSRYRVGPDISASMDPAELSLLISRSTEIWKAVNNQKQRTSAEESVYKFARGSIVADRPIIKGQTITKDDIWARRPGTGEIAAHYFYELIGTVASRDIPQNQQICWSDLEMK